MRKNPGSRGGWEQRLPLKLCVRGDLSQKGGGLLSFNTTRGSSVPRPRISILVCFWVGWAIRGMCWCEIWRAEVKISESRSEEAIILVPVLARWASALVYHSVWQLTSLLGGHQLCDCLPLPWVLLQLFRSWSRCVFSSLIQAAGFLLQDTTPSGLEAMKNDMGSDQSSRVPACPFSLLLGIISPSQLPVNFKLMMCVLVTQSCPSLCNLMDYSPPGCSVHGVLQAKMAVGCHSLLQGIFPTQGLNSCLLKLLHCRWIFYHLSHQAND